MKVSQNFKVIKHWPHAATISFSNQERMRAKPECLEIEMLSNATLFLYNPPFSKGRKVNYHKIKLEFFLNWGKNYKF